MFLSHTQQPASYGKKNGMWYASPGNQGWGGKGGGGGGGASRKQSVMDADGLPPATSTNSLKPSAGRVIRIINSMDHSVQVRTITIYIDPDIC